MRHLVPGVCLVLLAAIHTASAALLGSISFEKPFDTISAEGERQVGDNWNFGGSTAVSRHFIRLTPDRQSRRGFVWSKEQITREEFSLVFTFRISGQAETWFGDGLALWITHAEGYQNGDFHGFTDKFMGFGVLFNTFRNTEERGEHQDVTLIQNDGTRTVDELNERIKVGCVAPGIRYHEKNAAFSPSLNMSRAKIQFRGNYVWISLDEKNSGEWRDCAGSSLNLPEGWIQQATIGITASTGSLADNHDVIALSVYDDAADFGHALTDEKVKNKTKHDLDDSLMQGDNAAKLRLLKRKYEQLIEDFEHQFTALKESTENTIKKLQEQEAEDTKYIQQLEQWINTRVTETVERSLDEVKGDVDKTLKETVQESAAKTSSWKLPFFVLLLVLAAIIAASYKKYQDLRKSHLL